MKTQSENKTLAVVIPVFNEAVCITENITEIGRILKDDGIDYTFMLVDDGSLDATWEKICTLTQTRSDIRAVRFARNFGKEAAVCAGLASIDADRYIIMDSDLQHPPHHVRGMIELMQREEADIVEGVKQSRGREARGYGLLARLYYRILKGLTGLELGNSSDFKLLERSVVDELRRFGETEVFFRGLVAWVGFKKVPYPFSVEERKAGKSRFSTAKLIRLATNSILSFTGKLLYLTIFGGLVFLLISAVLGIQTLVNYFTGQAVSGFSTVILLVLFTGSMIMISLGIIGAYIARIYDEVKRRPRYIISERTERP